MVRIRWNQGAVERRDAQGRVIAIEWTDVVKVQGRWTGITITAADKRRLSFSPLQSGAGQLVKIATRHAQRNAGATTAAITG
jgi:hypothetical protein